MVSSEVKMDPDGHEPSGKSRHDNDPSISTNKHLTRLVRFSILQARRSSHASKVAQQNKGTGPPPPLDTKSNGNNARPPSPPAVIAGSPVKAKPSPPAGSANFQFASFFGDKERPSTEVQYEYNDAPGRHGVSEVVDVPTDPPIIEDISASLTLSAGENSDFGSGSLSEGGVADEDMDLLLAPDSGSAGGIHPTSSNEVYNSAEMYSSSGNYDDDESDHSSEVSTESSDSIMRRVEEEIANARKASNDAQARLAYFTQKQKELSPVMTDSYSFDFENLEASGDIHQMLDVGEAEALGPSHHHHHGYHGQGPAVHGHRHGDPTTHDENFNNAMGVIGKEFDTSTSTDVEEKVDIEVVLAPSSQKTSAPQKPKFDRHRSPAYNRRSPRGGPTSRSPRVRADDSVDIDEAVISAVFSEKSIESLPVKDSFPQVFSEQSMESLPTQPTQSSIAQSSLGRPASYSFQQDYGLSPGSQKRHNTLSAANKAVSPHPPNISIETDSNFASKTPVSPLTTATSTSKLPSTPREPNTPSYRERLENKLKILGSRYPVSPGKSTTSSNKKESASPTKTPKSASSIQPLPSTPNNAVTSAAVVTSPLGEAYDGLESRIKDLLARTLNPGPSEVSQSSDKEVAYQSSPSAELKAIKKLLEQGVAAAAAAEERKRELQEREGQYKNQVTHEPPGVTPPTAAATPNVSVTPVQSERLELDGQARDDDLHLPVLDEHQENVTSEEQSQLSKSKSNETAGSKGDVDRLPMRSSGSVPPVMEAAEEKEPEPSVACSTSEEILEALDSFSQSTEFKSKSRKSTNAKPVAPSPKPEISGEEDALSCKVKEVLDQSESNSENEAVSMQQITVESPTSRGGNLVASLKTYIESAIKPSDSDAVEIEHCEEQAEEQVPSISEAHVEKTDSKSFETVADSAQIQESAPKTVPLEENHDSPPPVAVESSSASIEIASHDEQYDERSEYESCNDTREYDSCTEGVREDEQTESITVTATSESKPDNGAFQEGQSHSSEVNSQATPSSRKTPSVLNAALSRPSLTDVKKQNERKARQRAAAAKAASADEEEKPENGTEAAIVASGSQTTVESSAAQMASSSTAAKDNNNSNMAAADTELTSRAQLDERKVTDNSFVPASPGGNRLSVIQPRPTDETEASEGRTLGSSPKEQSMLASLIGPDKNPELQPQEQPLPPDLAKASPNEKENERAAPEGGRDTPLPNRVRTVTLQSPKSPAKESDEGQRSRKPKNESAKPRSVTTRGDRKIRFRDPYPTPKPCRKPRSTEEIQSDHRCKPSHSERKIRWKEPKGDLKRLLVAALDSSVSRRSNACGALKVISKLEKNKITLVRTKGFLEALVFVATDEITSDEPEAKEDARARAISCIYNVSHVKENRLIVCTHRGLLDCLVKTINEDRGEARMEACGILAQLAKSSMCRDMMVGVDELLSTLASVLKGTIDPEEKMLDILSEDVTEDIPSSYSEMSSVLTEEQIPFPKSPNNDRKDQRPHMRANCSIRKQKSEMYDQYFELARLSSCAALIHLSKQCSILDHFCSNMFLLESIVQVARDSKSTLHSKCLEMLCNVSRLPGNTVMMTRFPGMIDTLIGAGSSKEAMDRIWALRTLQNLTSDASSKAPLATSTLLTLLINCVTSRNTGEQHAAMATLLNLSTDPSAVVPITSTKNVLATLVYLAHNSDSTSEIRLMACNALATVGLWLQTVSGFGSIPEETRRVLLPSHKTTGWDIWD